MPHDNHIGMDPLSSEATPEEQPAKPRRAEFTTPPNRLKRMAATPGGKTLAEMTEAGNTVVEEMGDEFIAESIDDISKLRALIEELTVNLKSPGVTTEEIYAIGARLTGVAGTFDYPLVTKMGKSLIDFVLMIIERGQSLNSDPRYGEVIQLHLGSIELVLAHKMTGEGGIAEFEMVQGLHKAVAKLSS